MTQYAFALKPEPEGVASETSTLQHAGSESTLWPTVAAILCAAFGVLLILNIQPIGDGVWYWYGHALRSGQHLYSDLHIPTQPFFAFASEWNQRLFGDSWLASKALAVFQDVLYCWGIYRVVSQLAWRGYQKALLIVAAYALTIFSLFYRFDDFHITSQCLTIFSIDQCLRIRSRVDDKLLLVRSFLLGMLSGACLANRLNDGALLLFASAVALLVFVPSKRWRAVSVFLAAAPATMVALILLTGDSLKTWAFETIFHAAAIKGGTGHVLSGPVYLPVQALIQLRPSLLPLAIVYTTAILVALALYTRQNYPHRRALWLPLLVAAVLAVLAAEIHPGTSLMAFTVSLILWILVGVLFLLARFFLRGLRPGLSPWNRSEVLLLFPIGKIVAGSITAAGSFPEVYSSIALLWLLIPFVFPALLASIVVRRCFFLLLALTGLNALDTKAMLPYDWHHFHETTMFTARTWFNHPELGPMYIRRSQLQIMQQMCGVVHKESTGSGQMLAMPWPYANYFCNVPPWHGYVQTWYDTTSSQTIRQLLRDINADPPEWIVYQRSPDTMAVHETVFLHGGQLPHRALDRLIVDKVASGDWSVRFQQCFDGADWAVIHTQPAPARADSVQDLLIPSTSTVNLCSRTNHGLLP